jgi:hypothetical protein
MGIEPSSSRTHTGGPAIELEADRDGRERREESRHCLIDIERSSSIDTHFLIIDLLCGLDFKRQKSKPYEVKKYASQDETIV